MSQAATKKNSRLPALVVWFGVVSLLTDVGTEMIYPLLPLFLADVLHAPRTFIGAVEGAAEATASLLKLVSGRISDGLARRKPLIVLGYGVSSLVRPIVGFAAHPWHVLATRVADRFGKGIRSGPRDALLADATDPAARGRAYGFHQAMDNAGALVGPLVATALLAVGWRMRSVFWFAAIPGALAMVALLFGVREPARKGGSDGGDASAGKPRSAAPFSPTMRRYLVCVALFGLGNSSDAFLLLRGQQCGVAVKWIPMLWMAHNGTKAALSTWGGALSDRLGRRRVIIAGWSLYAVTYLLFGLASRAWQIWALFVVYGVYYSLVEGSEKALVADLVPAGARGRAFGWFNAVIGVAALPASLAFGALADHFGARVAFTVSASLAALASLWLALVVRIAAPRNEDVVVVAPGVAHHRPAARRHAAPVRRDELHARRALRRDRDLLARAEPIDLAARRRRVIVPPDVRERHRLGGARVAQLDGAVAAGKLDLVVLRLDAMPLPPRDRQHAAGEQRRGGDRPCDRAARHGAAGTGAAAVGAACGSEMSICGSSSMRGITTTSMRRLSARLSGVSFSASASNSE